MNLYYQNLHLRESFHLLLDKTHAVYISSTLQYINSHQLTLFTDKSMNNTDTIMSLLKNKVNKIKELIPENSEVIYLDYPNHLNVGDLLIYLGTEQFFKDNNINVVLRQNLRNFSIKTLKKKAKKNTVFLCHGGGNFGDLYDKPHWLREELVKNFKDNKIIILPQTIHFECQENEKKSIAIFNQHKDVTILTRDKKSFELSKKFSQKIFLMPDMAHCLWPHYLDPNITPKESKLYFLRQDDEKKQRSTRYRFNRLG